MKKTNKKIFLTGGGSGGSVTPLLAMVDLMNNEKLKINSSHKLAEADNYKFLWLGTDYGPERRMVEDVNIDFKVISSGKFRRYFSLKNFTDIFRIIKGFFDSLKVIKEFKPDLMISAGGFVSVPVAYACFLKNVPVVIHQQDLRAGLANKLMAPLAKKITVTFEKSLNDYGKKAQWLGNPIRKEFLEHRINLREAKQKLGLRSEKPIVLVAGGGTGAASINEFVRKSVKDLTEFCQIIHITGKDKELDFAKVSSSNLNYKNFEFLNTEGMLKVFTVCDVIISRCGMNFLTEICFFKKSAILIPMPDSHQEDNAKIFAEREATIVLDEKEITKESFVNDIHKVISDKKGRDKLLKEDNLVIRIAKAYEFVEVINSL